MKSRKYFVILLSCVSLLLAGGCNMAVKLDPPKKLGGWVRSARPRKVNPENIFDYMNGAGELYLAYSFVGLDVWKYKNPGQPDILLEVYEMRNSPDAFGVLSFELRGEEVGIGQKSVYAAGLLRFWKGKHFVRILADAETPEAKAAVLNVGKDVAAGLPGKGSQPELVARLSETGLLPQSVHYFHRKICLDFFYYLADDNILNLDDKTDAVMADYRTPSGDAKLLVVEYDSEAAAVKSWRSFHRSYLDQDPPEAGVIDARQIEGEQWVCSQRKGKLLLIVFEGKSRRDCQELLHQAASNMVRGG